jgi:dTDP-4-dehydrorhamnose reductase (EC 1.1.1.133)
LENKPWLVINTAAFTDVDGCEDSLAIAYAVNALGAKTLLRPQKKQVQFSSI